ncbi:DUF2336 domain-containing protein [Oryzibacter oryziterrae]|uniref:DUF2336 domain-containing protein n=1 Tax=Oryzibacter oryziterrae TaxID=2766474 RepID=UPI001F37B254|nr:DUF2336 domain-containing protein [Oryzibacter oryziterrae]
MDWLEKAPSQARASAIPPLVRSYFQPQQSAPRREAIETALTMLLDDPSIDVRRSFAEAIAIHEAAPRHMIIALSHDLPLVSEVIFRRSPCLIDSELIEAVGSAGARVQVAVASRPWISFAVSQAIADEGDREAVLAMIANEGADLDEITFRTIAARFGEDGDVREALFARDDLPLAVRQSLIASLGAKLNLFLVTRDWMPEKRARNVVRDACDKATVLLAHDADEDDLEALVQHLRASGQLTTSLLIRSMCQGHLRFLEVALSILTGIPSPRVYALLVDGREAALRALFERAGLPERSHAAFIAALEVWRELEYDGAIGDRFRFARRMVERVLTRYQQFAQADVDDLLAMLRRLAAEAAREAARAQMRRARDAAAANADDLSQAA